MSDKALALVAFFGGMGLFFIAFVINMTEENPDLAATTLNFAIFQLTLATFFLVKHGQTKD